MIFLQKNSSPPPQTPPPHLKNSRIRFDFFVNKKIKADKNTNKKLSNSHIKKESRL